MIFIYHVLMWMLLLSLVGVDVVYGSLTSWYRSRTGIGFFSLMVAFTIVVALTLFGAYGIRLPYWIPLSALGLVILTVNLGITWNILYKQFIEHRPETIRKSNPRTKETNNV